MTVNRHGFPTFSRAEVPDVLQLKTYFGKTNADIKMQAKVVEFIMSVVISVILLSILFMLNEFSNKTRFLFPQKFT